jgi:hypothetical protein
MRARIVVSSNGVVGRWDLTTFDDGCAHESSSVRTGVGADPGVGEDDPMRVPRWPVIEANRAG